MAFGSNMCMIFLDFIFAYKTKNAVKILISKVTVDVAKSCFQSDYTFSTRATSRRVPCESRQICEGHQLSLNNLYMQMRTNKTFDLENEDKTDGAQRP